MGLSSEVICRTISIAGFTIELIARTAARLVCTYQLRKWANAHFLGTPLDAISETAQALGNAGSSINGQEALDNISLEVEEVIPPLARLKTSEMVALTEIIEVHPIDRVSLSIGIPFTQMEVLGPVTIDGIGFKVQATSVIQRTTDS